MTDISNTALRASLINLLDKISARAESEPEPDWGELEKMVRLVSGQLKAMDDVDTRRDREAERRAHTRYTRFEDLALPPPDEYARMVEMLNRHFGVGRALAPDADVDADADVEPSLNDDDDKSHDDA